MAGIQVVRFFEPGEFKCPCGECEFSEDGNMDPTFMRKLTNARDFAEVPFVINSGRRCVKHNAEVGGKEDSPHTRGMAVDIKCVNSTQRFRMVRSLIGCAFRRIGVYGTHIHVDNDTTKPPDVMWLG